MNAHSNLHLVDAHCHLQDDRLAPELSSLLARGRAAGIGAMICCGTREQDWNRVLELSEKHADIHPSLGVHPWYADQAGEGWARRLDALLGDTRCGVGEIGLDHVLDKGSRAIQETVFRTQLALARKHGRPVSIHCRKAWGTLVSILEEEGGLSRGGLIHSYSGSPEMVAVLEKLGCCISFSGSITRTRNKRGHASCRAVSRERLLIETDSPDLMPVSTEGAYNEPANILKVVAAVGRLREIPEWALGELTTRNAKKLFEIPS